jgi:cytochrome c-type biogenesis protein CcmH/NrfG
MMRGLALLAAVGVVFAGGPELDQARKLYQSTQFEQSLRILEPIPSKDAPTYILMGRDYFMLGEYKKATEVLEQAVQREPKNGDAALWLGRAWGRRAETSSPFTAPGYASKARQNFEKAVQLEPHNLEALSDLFEYYLEAPGFLGGGADKAQALATRMAAINPAEGHWANAKLAEKRKDIRTAEEQLKRAVEAAPRSVGKLIDLARFFVSHGRFQDAQTSLASAEKIDPAAPKLLFEKAELYIKEGKNPELARDLLKRYLNSNLTPDDPPRSEATKLLRQVQGG